MQLHTLYINTRYIYSEVKRYETERISNKSTYWLIWELTCRDFYRFISKKYQDRIFYITGPKGIKKYWNYINFPPNMSPNTDVSTTSIDNKKNENNNKNYENFDRWKNGQTGVPIVDANMRELKMTGFMSNRGRQIVASYLIHELLLDWRLGASWFESLLIDHDVYVNYANWNAAAGLTGGRVNRFNMTKQSRDYDPNGTYIKYWLPELNLIPSTNVLSSYLFEPWLMPKEEQQRYQLAILPYYDYITEATSNTNNNIKKYPEPTVLPKTPITSSSSSSPIHYSTATVKGNKLYTSKQRQPNGIVNKTVFIKLNSSSSSSSSQAQNNSKKSSNT